MPSNTPRPFFACGKWKSRSTDAIKVHNPYTDKPVATVSKATWTDIDKALDFAVVAFEEWRKVSASKRYDVLIKTAQGIEQRSKELASIIVSEAGKPISAARTEVERAIETMTFSAEEAKRDGGEIMRLDTSETSQGRLGLIRRFPLGVVFGITPFNFPLNLVCHKVGPAVAAGCTVIIKPASQTPLSALALAEIMEGAGAGGLIQVLPTDNEHASRAIADDRVSKFSFTGSAKVGFALKESVPRKHVTLELGGNAAVIVEPDADLHFAATRIAFGGFGFAGQSCISAQRVLVHSEIYDAFKDLIGYEALNAKVGDPTDEDVLVGPMIDDDAVKRIQKWIKNASGAVVAGGTADGRCFMPTVLEDVAEDAEVWTEEAFAPLVVLKRYDDFDDAIRIVNDSSYGLQAAVFTNDIAKIHRAHRDLVVGGVIHNDVTSFRADQMPYGGTKNSGFGREGVRWAMDSMSEPRILVLSGLDL